jgi:hypothetical protein
VRISTVRAKYTSETSPLVISASDAVWKGRFGAFEAIDVIGAERRDK